MNKFNDAVKFATFSTALIIHLYFNSLPAQRLMDSSVFLADLMYAFKIFFQFKKRFLN